MSKKIFKIIFIVLVSIFVFVKLDDIDAVNQNSSLKDLKNSMAKLDRERQAASSRKNKTEKEIKSMESDIDRINKEIEDNNKAIEDAYDKIADLDEEIINKQKEIDNLLSFLQVSEGENVYLEYVFQAKNFTDFIYRGAVVEQLTKYNDDLIDDMYKKIEENKALQVQLQEDIKKGEQTIKNFEEKLKTKNLTLGDLIKDETDAEAEYAASKREVQYYEKIFKENKCKETTSINECLGVAFANKLTRPVNSGWINSEWGLRFHPTKHTWRLHNGIDIGVSTGTKVYASAPGVVVKKIVRSSCGGNELYIRHNLKGVGTVQTYYYHLSAFKVKVGDKVDTNTVIALSGGGESYDACSTGPHLHFGVSVVSPSSDKRNNPRNFINFPAKGKKFKTRYY